MHELSLCRALVAQVEAVARGRRARGVRTVRVRLGPLAGVEPSLLETAYPIACAGTAAEGSRLVIESAPVRVRCEACGAVASAAANRLVCGRCGSRHTRLESGDELILVSVELVVEEQGHV